MFRGSVKGGCLLIGISTAQSPVLIQYPMYNVEDVEKVCLEGVSKWG